MYIRDNRIVKYAKMFNGVQENIELFKNVQFVKSQKIFNYSGVVVCIPIIDSRCCVVGGQLPILAKT